MSQINPKNIDELLLLFVSTDEMRPKFMKPWREHDYVFASETHIIIRINGNLTETEYPAYDTPETNRLFPAGAPDGTVLFSDLEAVLAKAPMEDEMDGEDEEIKCEECDGEGTVTWDYKTWSREFDCPACNGRGYTGIRKAKPTGRKIIDSRAGVMVGPLKFSAFLLGLLLEAMRYCGCGQATATFGKKAARFSLSDDIDIIIAPFCSYAEYYASIPLKRIIR